MQIQYRHKKPDTYKTQGKDDCKYLNLKNATKNNYVNGLCKKIK